MIESLKRIFKTDREQSINFVRMYGSEVLESLQYTEQDAIRDAVEEMLKEYFEVDEEDDHEMQDDL